MYLISIYFDEKTEKTVQRLINKVAVKSGNTYMMDAKVPPHITISAFEAKDENRVIELLDENIKKLKMGTLNWVSIGVFNANVIFLTPVLNEYLYNLSVKVYESISYLDDVSINKYYLPLAWLPHTTIGKKLSGKEIFLAFEALQNSFSVFTGNVTRISVTKTNPFKEIRIWNLK